MRQYIDEFLDDSQKGRFVGGSKGRRSYSRLYAHRSHLKKWEEWAKQYFDKKLSELTDDDLLKIHYDLDTGNLVKANGQKYEGIACYVRTIKAFWHWHSPSGYYQKHQRPSGADRWSGYNKHIEKKRCFLNQ